MLVTSQQIESVKEGGKYKVYKLRFPDVYPWDDCFYIRTLNRGEIEDAFIFAGYPERAIPEEDKKASCKLEDRIFATGVFEAPEGFDYRFSPAGLPEIIAKKILEYSGFESDTETQIKQTEIARRYSNSFEGRADGLIRHTLFLSKDHLRDLTYPDWLKELSDTLQIQEGLYGRDATGYLKEGIAQQGVLAAEPEYKLPTPRPPGLKGETTVLDERSFKATGNLDKEQQKRLLALVTDQVSRASDRDNPELARIFPNLKR